MVERDKNHASIVIWSLCNETLDNKFFKQAAEKIRKRDPSRVLHFDRDYGQKYVDMYSSMYASPEDISRHLARQKEKPESERMPAIICEYAHAMGNSGASPTTGSSYARNQCSKADLFGTGKTRVFTKIRSLTLLYPTPPTRKGILPYSTIPSQRT